MIPQNSATFSDIVERAVLVWAFGIFLYAVEDVVDGGVHSVRVGVASKRFEPWLRKLFWWGISSIAIENGVHVWTVDLFGTRVMSWGFLQCYGAYVSISENKICVERVVLNEFSKFLDLVMEDDGLLIGSSPFLSVAITPLRAVTCPNSCNDLKWLVVHYRNNKHIRRCHVLRNKYGYTSRVTRTSLIAPKQGDDDTTAPFDLVPVGVVESMTRLLS
ncbi:hypothetical protein DVH24_001272 [Malus domestica]|uniref:Uncharacterized protein n=1 Tax=Malus domestica TaxID=3750 RepID=A0A498K159_MALDO|nr:hypothetical protein DVH24_001272 [Malus domestica]